MKQILRFKKLALVVVAALGAAAPGFAGVKSNLAALLESATGGVVVSIEKIKGMERFGDPATPSAIKVPANTHTQVVCAIVAGKLQCYQAAIDVCPGSLILSQGETSYSCETDCHGNTPSSSGECECDIRYDTCVPFP